MKHLDGLDLRSLFDSIDGSSISFGELSGLAVFDDASTIACRDSSGDSVILIACDNVEGSNLNRIEGAISTMGSRKYNVSVDGQIISGYFCSLSLSWRQPGLLGVFCSVVAGLVSTLSDEPAQSEVDQILLDYVRLLSRRDYATREVVLGLWGELRVIAQSSHPQKLFSAWRSDQRSLFDFVTDELKFEVKTTESSKDIHDFSHKQLTVDRDGSVIVSIGVISSNAGESLSDLIDAILSGLEFSDRRELIARVGETLGRSIEYLDEYKFVLRDQFGMRCVRSEYVPSLDISDIDSISNVRYSVDMSTCLIEFGFDLTTEQLDRLLHL
ncbi:PD-(D/E)XK motif protein [Arthrobacter glacialis]|uniref:PD-(D/E)XK motif protein n=1 Tax=Arthrobacter glacialis TaxID=1664 RepID=A0A2S3ZW07_ARTGL|nr:PD-(D/E)XK motif protein [Arthrobacter glacialis]POH73077.1 hypothetical protein CVS27_13030 [Arthrobacter glacialis]